MWLRRKQMNSVDYIVICPLSKHGYKYSIIGLTLCLQHLFPLLQPYHQQQANVASESHNGTLCVEANDSQRSETKTYLWFKGSKLQIQPMNDTRCKSFFILAH